ncbi:MAG: isoprenylcysteine carboxylmethyltransferase family protein [Idiomarina sp.]|nr:isoprenylcysteine carboxylmethyltransferase family protein [Idiomarina sp.]
MKKLECKVPPLLLMVIVAGLIALVHLLGTPFAAMEFYRLPVTGVLLALGVLFCVSAVVSFRRAQTTVNPMHPEESSQLVTSGVFRLTRNPMYLGFCFILASWAMFLAVPPALLLVVLFALYLTRWQIMPEERALISTFGEDYLVYLTQVKRWL